MKTKLLFIIALLSGCSLFAQVGFLMDKSVNVVTSTDTISIYRNGKKETKEIYSTVTILKYKEKTREEWVIAGIREKLFNELSANSKLPATDIGLSQAERDQREDSIVVLDEKLAKIKHEQDSLYYKYYAELLNYKRLIFAPGPIGSRTFFDMMYGGNGNRFKAMGNSGVNFGDSTVSIYSELASGNMGLVRVALGTMVTSNGSEDSSASQDAAFQRLITKGGNTVLSLEYPLLYAHTRNDQFNCIARPNARGTMDFPAFGKSTEVLTGSLMIGFDLYADCATDNKQLRFFGNVNYNYLWGTSYFKTNLGTNNAQFSFGQATLGLVFLEHYKISFIVATWSSESILRNRKVIAGGQVIR